MIDFGVELLIVSYRILGYITKWVKSERILTRNYTHKKLDKCDILKMYLNVNLKRFSSFCYIGTDR